MDFEKLAEASHQAWFVAMAKQGWIFGPRLNPDFKTHPWLKPYAGLSDGTKEIVRAQVRGTLAALEASGASPGAIPEAARPATEAPSRPAPPTPPPAARPRAPEPAPRPTAAPTGETLERKIDASGRMRIGSGLVKKAELLAGGATQVAIVQNGAVIEVLRASEAAADAFFASVNPDGFMPPKAMLAGTGASDFMLTILPGRLIVQPK